VPNDTLPTYALCVSPGPVRANRAPALTVWATVFAERQRVVLS
jgi:hypothetical protein